MNTLRVAWLLTRPGTVGRSALLLPVIAFGVATALLLTVLGGATVFFSWGGDMAGTYQACAVIAVALLVVPLISLGGSAARLAARRRDDRLATLRLLGASPAMVRTLTVLEATALALAGALAGIVGYAVLVPLVGLIPFRGEPLGAGSLWLSPLVVAAVVAGVAIIAALSAVIGLRGVIISPLGVRTRQTAPRLHWLRAVIAVAVVLVVLVAMQLLGSLGAVVIVLAVLAAGFGGTMAVLGLIGPWVIGLLARGQARRARTPQRLIAARTVLESPKTAWRQVSGVAMTTFTAVFAGSAVALASAAGGSADRDTVLLMTDIRTGVLITVVVSFLMVACSVGVNQASGILDRRDLYVSLDRLGMPRTTMDAARRRAIMSPLRQVTLGSALCAAVVILPLTGISLIVAPLSLATIAVCIAAGVGLVWLGLRVTRPVLERAVTEPGTAALGR
jgi:hypothetical protein